MPHLIYHIANTKQFLLERRFVYNEKLQEETHPKEEDGSDFKNFGLDAPHLGANTKKIVEGARDVVKAPFAIAEDSLKTASKVPTTLWRRFFDFKSFLRVDLSKARLKSLWTNLTELHPIQTLNDFRKFALFNGENKFYLPDVLLDTIDTGLQTPGYAASRPAATIETGFAFGASVSDVIGDGIKRLGHGFRSVREGISGLLGIKINKKRGGASGAKKSGGGHP